MPAIHRRILRDFEDVLDDIGAHREPDPTKVEAVRKAVARARNSGANVRKKHRERTSAKQVAYLDERATIRAQVEARAAGSCEACGVSLFGIYGEVDEFFGGSGRRRQMMSAKTCWLLHAACHRDKTENLPNAGHWIRLFAAHCRKHGLLYEAAQAEKRLPPELAPATDLELETP